MKTLQKEISDFHFHEREKVKKKYVSNKSGRDFLFYSMEAYSANKFEDLKSMDTSLGTRVPSFFAWSLFQFSKIGKFLKGNNLKLEINNKEVNNFMNFFNAISYSKIKYEEAIEKIEESIDNNISCGIDVSIGLGGLLDHVMFVFGYDEENLYIIDTHFVEDLGYMKTDYGEFVMRLPK